MANPKKLKIVYKYFPLPIHGIAKPAAYAAHAAFLQGQFWKMHDMLYNTQHMLTGSLIQQHAQHLHLKMAKYEKDRQSQKVLSAVEKSIEEGTTLGLVATPSFFIDGRPYALPLQMDCLELRAAMEKARRTSKCD